MYGNPRLDRPDQDLVREAVESAGTTVGRSAASELLGRYSARVLRWCERYARTPEDARDLAQQVLLRAYEKLDSFQGRAAFSSWLFMVTRSTCLNAVTRVDFLRDAEFELEDLADPGLGPETALERLQDEEFRLRMIREVLEPTEQKAMILRYYEHLPPDEITRLLTLDSRSGARGVLQRARRKLAAALATRGDTDAS